MVANNFSRDYQAKEPQLIKHIHKVKELSTHFKSFEVKYVHREKKIRANILPKLSSTKITGYNQTIIHENLVTPSIDAEETYALEVVLG